MLLQGSFLLFGTVFFVFWSFVSSVLLTFKNVWPSTVCWSYPWLNCFHMKSCTAAESTHYPCRTVKILQNVLLTEQPQVHRYRSGMFVGFVVMLTLLFCLYTGTNKSYLWAVERNIKLSPAYLMFLLGASWKVFCSHTLQLREVFKLLPVLLK